MQQPILFELASLGAQDRARKPQRLDAGSETALASFVEFRRREGAAASTARSEAGQLRSMCQALASAGQPLSPLELLRHADALASLLAFPGEPVSESTNRLRLRSLGHFARYCEAELALPVSSALDELYRLLPVRPCARWNYTGTVLGGERGKRNKIGRTMFARDLEAVLDAGPSGSGYGQVRDRTLLALACYTGLRATELSSLRWEQVWPRDDHIAITVKRAGHEHVLMGFGRALPALLALAAVGRARLGRLYGIGGRGPVFRRDNRPHEPIGDRQIAGLIKRAVMAAGFPLAGQSDIKRAFVHWLKLQGLSDHEAMSAAGIRDARTLDSRLERVRRLNAQTMVAETMNWCGEDGRSDGSRTVT